MMLASSASSGWGAVFNREPRPDPDILVSNALNIARHQRSWFDRLPVDYLDDALIPAAHNGRLLFVCSGQAFATVAFPSMIPKDRITRHLWSEDGPHLWIIDAVGMPHLPWMRVGLALRRGLVEQGFAKRGDKVFFWRMHAERYGFVTL